MSKRPWMVPMELKVLAEDEPAAEVVALEAMSQLETLRPKGVLSYGQNGLITPAEL